MVYSDDSPMERGRCDTGLSSKQTRIGVFVAEEAPAPPGCLSRGRTRAEAIENIKEAIAVYLESLKAHAEPIPPSICKETVEESLLESLAAYLWPRCRESLGRSRL